MTQSFEGTTEQRPRSGDASFPLDPRVAPATGAPPGDRSNTRRAILVGAALVSQALLFVAVAVIAFGNNADVLFVTYDGAYFQDHLAWSRDFFAPTTALQGVPYNGLYDLQLIFNHWILGFPYLVDLTDDQDTLKVLIYLAAALVMHVGMIGAARLWGYHLLPATVIGWAMPLMYFPFLFPQPVYAVSGLSPWGGVAITAVAVTLGLFARIGRQGIGQTVALSVAIALTLAAAVTYSPYYVPSFLPILIVFGLGLLIVSRRRETLLKAAAATVLLLASLTTIAPFLLGLYTHAAAIQFPGQISDYDALLTMVSILFNGREEGPWGAAIVVVFVLCAVVTLLRGRAPYRTVAGIALVCYALLLGVGLLLHFGFPDYVGPRVRNTEVFLWPFMVMTIVAGFRTLAVPVLEDRPALGGRAARRRRLATVSGGVACAAALGAIVLDSFNENGRQAYANSWQFPPRSSPLTDILREEIALEPGSRFNGIVATFTPMADAEAGLSWPIQTLNDRYLAAATGNGHRAVDLWYFNIPTLFTYNQVLSPAYFQMIRHFLAAPQDDHTRNIIILSRPNPDYLRLLGVRFVLTDAPMAADPHLAQRWTVPVSANRRLFLYELSDVNLGDASPSQWDLAETAAQTAARLAEPDFDFRRAAVVHEPLPDELVPASGAALRLERGGFRLSARSAGTSLLVLPIQFSQCLEARPADGGVPPTLRRVNLMQTGVLFNGTLDIHLRLRFGPFHDPWCRLRDVAALRALNVGRPLPGWAEQAARLPDRVPPGRVEHVAASLETGARVPLPPASITSSVATETAQQTMPLAVDGDPLSFANSGPLPPGSAVDLFLTFGGPETISGVDLLARQGHGHLLPQRISIARFDSARQHWIPVLEDAPLSDAGAPWQTIRFPPLRTERLRLSLDAGHEAGHWYVQPAEILVSRAAPAADHWVLSWTNTGDDGANGIVERLEMRWSDRPIDSMADWQAAWPLPLPVAEPGPPGTEQSGSLWRIQALDGLRYLAIRAVDEAGNAGDIGTVALPVGTASSP